MLADRLASDPGSGMRGEGGWFLHMPAFRSTVMAWGGAALALGFVAASLLLTASVQGHRQRIADMVRASEALLRSGEALAELEQALCTDTDDVATPRSRAAAALAGALELLERGHAKELVERRPGAAEIRSRRDLLAALHDELQAAPSPDPAGLPGRIGHARAAVGANIWLLRSESARLSASLWSRWRGISVLLVLACLLAILSVFQLHRMGRQNESLRAAQAALAESEEARFHSQKLEAVGRLAGGVAHEFSNLLTVIGGLAELLQHELGPRAPGSRELAGIQDAVRRATRLTRELLSFSSLPRAEACTLDLNEALRGLEPWLRGLCGEGTTLELRLMPRPLPVHIDPARLEQVLVNLASNARDAMSGRGKLTIETDLVEDPARDGRRCACLAVADTGMGMSLAVLERAFEPFFTTKERGKGTGLGLAICQGIVTQAGGTIRAESVPGHGTLFEIQLPLSAEPVRELVPAARARAAVPAVASGRGDGAGAGP
jgi:signal transduction histidine kinase